jgi:hypothetical protein
MSRAAFRAAFFLVREVYYAHLEHLYPILYKATTPDPLSSPPVANPVRTGPGGPFSWFLPDQVELTPHQRKGNFDVVCPVGRDIRQLLLLSVKPQTLCLAEGSGEAHSSLLAWGWSPH